MAPTFPGRLTNPGRRALAVAGRASLVVARSTPPIEIAEPLLKAGAALLARDRISPEDDLFIVGGNEDPMHPLLVDALVLVVDRSQRRIGRPARQRARHRPLFLIEKGDGHYVCGFCSVEGDSLVVESHPDIASRSQRLKKEDATTIGQVVAVVRRF